MITERPQWLNEKEVARMTSISVQTLRNWRHKGEGPRYDKPSPRVVRYPLEEVQRFMERRK
jgi:predicted DNA-binding transcriptional regulator AlpA